MLASQTHQHKKSGVHHYPSAVYLRNERLAHSEKSNNVIHPMNKLKGKATLSSQ